KNQCQFLEGHAGCFGSVQPEDLASPPIKVLSFVERKKDVNKLYITELASGGSGGGFKAVSEFTYPSEYLNDFPISEHYSARHGVFYFVTKTGLVMVFDGLSGKRLVCEKVLSDGIFLCTGDSRSGGILTVNQ